MSQYNKKFEKYEMLKRKSSQGEEEGTFNVLHIIPLIFFPSFYFFSSCFNNNILFHPLTFFGKCFKETPDSLQKKKKLMEACIKNE